MTTTNKSKYYNHSHISEVKFRQLIKCFSMDLNANEAAKLTNTSHTSCREIFLKHRIYIFHNLLESNISQGELELDESYFGAKRVRGKRGRVDADKTPVFGLLK